MRLNTIRPALKATGSGAKPDSPAAITSAFTHSPMPDASRKRCLDELFFPGRFGPARMIILGFAIGSVDF